MAVAGGGGADPLAQQLPRSRPAGKGHQLRQPLHPPPQGRGRWSAPCNPAAGTRLALLRHATGGNAGKGCDVESVRPYASMPPDEAETKRVWVRRRDAAAGGAGNDWATCLHLLERTAAAANVACNSAALMAALLTCVWGGGVSSFRAVN